RIKNANDRPLLSNISPEKIENLMSKRIPNFEKAHIKIDTDNKTLYNVVKEIKECLR
ncbi:shikimate kinase, partial [bacterium]|nr:shikimate kinase [bacterium]